MGVRRLKNRPSQSFNDGIVTIRQMRDTAAPGDMENLQPVDLYTLRFEERMVGMQRRYLGLQDDMRIDKLIRVQRRDDVTTDDTALIDGQEYKVRQIQYVVDIRPRVMDLSLERLVHG